MSGNKFGRNKKRKLLARLAKKQSELDLAKKYITSIEKELENLRAVVDVANKIVQTAYNINPNHTMFTPTTFDTERYNFIRQKPDAELTLVSSDANAPRKPVIIDMVNIDLLDLEMVIVEDQYTNAVHFVAHACDESGRAQYVATTAGYTNYKVSREALKNSDLMDMAVHLIKTMRTKSVDK